MTPIDLSRRCSHGGGSVFPWWRERFPMVAGAFSHGGGSVFPWWRERFPMVAEILQSGGRFHECCMECV
jgi:hypothetical protein